MFLLGLAAAIVAAILFNLGIALQAIEARRSPKSLSLKVGLVAHLLRRPLWLLGGALGIVGFGPQLLALAYAPFAVVQTALTAGLALLLFIAMRYLGEQVDRTALIGVGLLITGVALVSWGAPAHSEAHRAALGPILVVGATALVAFSPFFLRRFGVTHGLLLAISSGVGFAGTNIATKLASEDIGRSHWANAVGWGVAIVVLGVCATVTSMSAIQRCAATMVVPVSTGVQTFLPIVLEPLFLHEHYLSFWTQLLPGAAGVVTALAGVALVGRDRAVSTLATGRRRFPWRRSPARRQDAASLRTGIPFRTSAPETRSAARCARCRTPKSRSSSCSATTARRRASPTYRSSTGGCRTRRSATRSGCSCCRSRSTLTTRSRRSAGTASRRS